MQEQPNAFGARNQSGRRDQDVDAQRSHVFSLGIVLMGRVHKVHSPHKHKTSIQVPPPAPHHHIVTALSRNHRRTEIEGNPPTEVTSPLSGGSPHELVSLV